MQGMTPHETELAAANGGQTASLISQLHGLIRFLTEHPDVPLTEYGETGVRLYAKTQAEVDALAARLHVTASWNTARTQYSAVRPFGTNVSYGITFITPAHMDAYNAHMASFPKAVTVAGVAA